MSGYSKLYCIGGLGGFQGADGINPIYFQILVGDGDRQWLKAHYFDSSIKPLGNIQVIVPEGPDHPNALIDACMAFFPKHFAACPSMEKVRKSLQKMERLDFNLEQNVIPSEWSQLRQEAAPYFETLNIFEATLYPYQKSNR